MIGGYIQPRYTKRLKLLRGLWSTARWLCSLLYSQSRLAWSPSRFDQRKQGVLAEVNAIETAYLQADLLADRIKRTEIKRYLLKYVDIRLMGVKTGAFTTY